MEFTGSQFAEVLVSAISKCAATGEPHNIRLTVDSENGPRTVIIAICPEDMLSMLTHATGESHRGPDNKGNRESLDKDDIEYRRTDDVS